MTANSYSNKLKIKPVNYWYLAISFCLLYIVISGFDIELGSLVKILYSISFYLFYYFATKKHNLFLIIIFVTFVSGEILVMIDLNLYFKEIVFLFMIGVLAMLVAFSRILKIKPQIITKEMVLEPVFGVLFCGYAIAHLVIVFYDSVPEKLLFVLAGILLFSTTLICTLIPLRYRNSYNVTLYIIAGSLVIESASAFIYYYSLRTSIILTLFNMSICLHKATVTSYLVSLSKLLKDKELYI